MLSSPDVEEDLSDRCTDTVYDKNAVNFPHCNKDIGQRVKPKISLGLEIQTCCVLIGYVGRGKLYKHGLLLTKVS